MKLKLPDLILASLIAVTNCVTAQVSVSSGNIYTENFDGLGAGSATWADNSTLTGWYAAVTNVTTGVVGPYTTAYTASSGGSVSSSTLYALGASGSSERALGSPASTTSQGMLGWRLVNSGSTTVSNLTVVYDAEQWRRDGTAVSTISVSYQIFSAGGGSLNTLGGWLAAPSSLTFSSVATGVATAIDGNYPTNRALWLTATLTGLSLQPNQEIWLKWTLAKVNGNNLPQAIDNVRVAVDLGMPPTIGTIPPITVMSAQTSSNADFTVNDPEGSLAGDPTVVSSTSEAVVPSANVKFGGSGTARTVRIEPAGDAGTAYVTIQAGDTAGNLVQKVFQVNVLPLNYAPFFSVIPPTNTLTGIDVAVPFTVGDAETPASSLTVAGGVASYSATILASVSLAADASGTNRTLTVTTVPGASGVGVVELGVSDPEGNLTTSAVPVMVRPATNVVFVDNFDYPMNANVRTASANLWLLCNASPGTYALRMANEVGVSGKVWVRGFTSADDCAGRLAGAPYAPGSGAVLYTKISADWVDYAGYGYSPTNDGSRGATFRLLNSASATSTGVAEICVATNNAPAGTFKAGLIDYAGTFVPSASNLGWPGAAVLVSRYDVDSGQSALWVNAVSESDPFVTAVDDLTPGNISYVQIRQDLGMGYIYVDSLQVTLVQKPVITSVTPPSGGTLELVFTADPYQAYSGSSFAVVGSETVDGPFTTTVPATISPSAPNAFKAVVTPGTERFFKVKILKPLTF